MIGETMIAGRVFLAPGDNREVLKSLPDSCLDSIVTDPPYALVSIVKRFGKADAKPARKGNGAKATGAFARSSKGFMGQHWDTGETAFAVEFWQECFRVLKPGGHVAAFSGTRTQHDMTAAIVGAGFEIRDDILRMFDSAEPLRLFMNSLDDAQRSAFTSLLDDCSPLGMMAWAYGTGFPKSHDVAKGIDKHLGIKRKVIGTKHEPNDMRGGALSLAGKGKPREGVTVEVTEPTSPQAIAAAGFGTALKPAWEPIILARKPLDGTVAANWLKHGTGGLNVDGCRVGEREKPKVTDPKRTSNTYGEIDSPGGKLLPPGRHPANLIHDGSDEVMAAFPYVMGAQGVVRGDEPSASTGDILGKFAQRAPSIPRGDVGSAARFYYSAKADADDRIGSNHPTVKPVDLMMWLVRLVTPRGGLVLDPFAGSGSTGEAAWAEGMRCILIEREPKYCDDIRRRFALLMSGPDERAREAIKANGKAKGITDDLDAVPLFKVLS